MDPSPLRGPLRCFDPPLGRLGKYGAGSTGGRREVDGYERDYNRSPFFVRSCRCCLLVETAHFCKASLVVLLVARELVRATSWWALVGKIACWHLWSCPKFWQWLSREAVKAKDPSVEKHRRLLKQ